MYVTYNGKYVTYNGKYAVYFGTPPDAPSRFFTSTNYATYATFNWWASVQRDFPVSYYEIWMDVNGFGYELIDTTTALTYTYNFTSYDLSPTYQFKVRAKDTKGNYSAFSPASLVITVVKATATLNSMVIASTPNILNWNMTVASLDAMGSYTFNITNVTQGSGTATFNMYLNGINNAYSGTVNMGFGITNTIGDEFALSSTVGITIFSGPLILNYP